MDYLDSLELSTADYVELEIANAMETAGQEWRNIAERKGYYTDPDQYTEEQTDRNADRFSQFDYADA